VKDQHPSKLARSHGPPPGAICASFLRDRLFPLSKASPIPPRFRLVPCVSAGERVHQPSRFGDTPTASLSCRKHTSARARVSAAACDQAGAAPFQNIELSSARSTGV